jgi:hypothetical protein
MEVRSFRLEGSAGVGDDAYLLEYGGRQRALYFRQGGTLVYVFDAPMRLVERVAKGIAQMLPAV